VLTAPSIWSNRTKAASREIDGTCVQAPKSVPKASSGPHRVLLAYSYDQHSLSLAPLRTRLKRAGNVAQFQNGIQSGYTGAILRRIAISTLVVILTTLASSCARVVGTSNSSPAQATQTISLSPPTPSVRAGGVQPFTAAVAGISNPQLTWSVNGVVGGNSEVGVISNTGTFSASYTAPTSVPAAAAVTIKATVTSKTSLTAAATANLLNSIPQLMSVSPSQLNAGAFTLTLSGASFVNGAVVSFGATTLATNFVSPTEITASGTVMPSEVGIVRIAVTNPNPGSATSSPLFAQILSGPPEAPQISVSPASVDVPTGGMANANLTVTGSPTPSVSCNVSGAGTALLSGSIVSYSAPNVVPENGWAAITCTAANAAGSTAASLTANISTIVPGYAGPIPSTYFAMHVFQPGDWPTVTIGALGKATGVAWPYIEQTKGQFNWARLDEFVNAANARGIGLMYSSESVPPWAAADKSTCASEIYFGPYCSSTVSDPQDWDDFVTALVTRYKGRIQIYELWNEPQQSFTGSMAQFVLLTQHEHDIIRSIDPAAVILSPSMISEGHAYLDSYFVTGGTLDIDAVAMHAYPDPSNDVPESITQSVSTSIKGVMTTYGLSGKALWNTETSWGQPSAGDITDPDLQAAFIARAYLLDWSVGISRFYWYAWDSPTIGTLWNPGGVPTEPATSYDQVRNWMLGATMPQPCSINGATSGYHAVYTCDLTRGGGYQARAVWNTDGTSTYTAPNLYVHYIDLRGNVVDVPADHQVTIGLKPILLENK